jgi:hypothetical protein
VLVDEVVGERVRLLAEEVHLMTQANQRPTEVLHIDVAPGAGEHVTVCHKKLHASAPIPNISLSSAFHAHITYGARTHISIRQACTRIAERRRAAPEKDG